VFAKPELIIVFDRLATSQPSTFEYWLHAVNQFAARDQRNIECRVENVACSIDILAPEQLVLTQTDQYDPNPWPTITTREWHLTAATPSKTKTAEFVALYRPHRTGTPVPDGAELTPIDGGYLLRAPLTDGSVRALLPTDDAATLTAAGMKTTGAIFVERVGTDGSVIEAISVGE
jgi:hypothetical protein